jgi:hypothetical protein
MGSLSHILGLNLSGLNVLSEAWLGPTPLPWDPTTLALFIVGCGAVRAVELDKQIVSSIRERAAAKESKAGFRN